MPSVINPIFLSIDMLSVIKLKVVAPIVEATRQGEDFVLTFE